MREFVLLFRMDIVNVDAQPSAEQMSVYMTQWTAWIEGMTAWGCVLQGGNHLSRQGLVLSGGKSARVVQSEGPHVAHDSSVAGYLLVQAEDRERVLGFARQCPILAGEGTSVEVRDVA